MNKRFYRTSRQQERKLTNQDLRSYSTNISRNSTTRYLLITEDNDGFWHLNNVDYKGLMKIVNNKHQFHPKDTKKITNPKKMSDQTERLQEKIRKHNKNILKKRG